MALAMLPVDPGMELNSDVRVGVASASARGVWPLAIGYSYGVGSRHASEGWSAWLLCVVVDEAGKDGDGRASCVESSRDVVNVVVTTGFAPEERWIYGNTIDDGPGFSVSRFPCC